MKPKCLVIFVLSLLIAAPAFSVPLVVNGDFSDGLSGWTDAGFPMTNSSYSGQVSIVNDAPMNNALRLNGLNGGNYYTYVYQEILLDQEYNNFDISFDWKVTDKEPNWGVNWVAFNFFDASDNLIGKISYFDTADSRYTLEYWKGNLADDQYYAERKWIEIFDWEHVSINSGVLTGLDTESITKIRIDNEIQTNIVYGGIMLTDNFSIDAHPVPEPSSLLLLGFGLVGLVGFRRRFDNKE